MRFDIKAIGLELREHIPFTFVATLIAVIFSIFTYKTNIGELFHLIHPLHLFASAIVSSAIFYKYKINFVQAFLIGVVGSIVIGSLSDVVFPYLGGSLLQLDMDFHLPLIEAPFIILLISSVGSIIGIKTKLTKLPHFVHVFLSVFASLFYLLAFSSSLNIVLLGISSLIIFIAVLIPCCISDIIFPLFFLDKSKK